MRNFRKCMRIFFVIIAIAMLGCSDDEVKHPSFDINFFEDDPNIQSINGIWKVISFEDYSNKSVEVATEENSSGLDILVTFDDTKNPKTVSGKNTSNYVSGIFDYVSTRSLKTDGLVSTKAGQPTWADQFLSVFYNATADFIVSENRLRIYFDGKNRSVTFSKQ
jgi:hypothetical protein